MTLSAAIPFQAEYIARMRDCSHCVKLGGTLMQDVLQRRVRKTAQRHRPDTLAACSPSRGSVLQHTMRPFYGGGHDFFTYRMHCQAALSTHSAAALNCYGPPSQHGISALHVGQAYLSSLPQRATEEHAGLATSRARPHRQHCLFPMVPFSAPHCHHSMGTGSGSLLRASKPSWPHLPLPNSGSSERMRPRLQTVTQPVRRCSCAPAVSQAASRTPVY